MDTIFESVVFQSGQEVGILTEYESFVLLYLFLLSCGVCVFFKKETRAPSFNYQRMQWEEHCNKHVARGTFKRRLRMEKESFDKLLSYIYHELLVKEQYAKMRGGSIIPELSLYCTLRWMAGGSYLDIVDISGISQPSFYRIVWKTIIAIVECPELELQWPTLPHQVQDAIAGFSSISDSQAVNNCAGVADGFLARIRVPGKREVGNVRSFFSGHYQCYGVNCQGVADHHCRFTFFAVAAPGVAKDRDAVVQCGLMDLIEDLPHGVCVIGDAAYQPTEHLVPVYQGADRTKPKYDNFNFCASQLRIRVEMAFGIMTKKWGILNRPLTISLSNVKWLMQAVARLHNFVINERLRMQEEGDCVDGTGDEKGSRAYLPSVPHEENGDPVRLDPLFKEEEMLVCEGYSGLREAMADRVARKKLTRPFKNRLRNEERATEVGAL